MEASLPTICHIFLFFFIAPRKRKGLLFQFLLLLWTLRLQTTYHTLRLPMVLDTLGFLEARGGGWLSLKGEKCKRVRGMITNQLEVSGEVLQQLVQVQSDSWTVQLSAAAEVKGKTSSRQRNRQRDIIFRAEKGRWAEGDPRRLNQQWEQTGELDCWSLNVYNQMVRWWVVGKTAATELWGVHLCTESRWGSYALFSLVLGPGYFDITLI